MTQHITLSEAALRLRRSYNQTQRLILTGQLHGERNAAGRWIVDVADLARFQREHEDSEANDATRM